MPIAKHPLSAVTEADLQAMITGGVREDRTLDFKRDTYGASDDSRAEFLADISALANTLGGDLVLGMDEEQGVGSALPGLGGKIDADQEILRLTQMAQTGLRPRLPSLEMRAVPLAAGGHALLIRVGRSYQAPHRVVFKGRNRFWARSSGGKYEPDVDELRALFSAAPQVATRLREIRSDRVAQVLAGETPVPLIEEPGVSLLHIIPLAAAGPTPRAPNLERMRSQMGAWAPWGAYGFNEHRNFDGFVRYSGAEGDKTQAYCQVFRSGMVEVVAANAVSVREARRTVWVTELAKLFLNQILAALPALRQGEVDPPYSVQLTLAGVRGASFRVEESFSSLRALHPSLPAERDVLHFVDAIVGEDDTTQDQVALAVRPTLDQLYQTASYRNCPWFNPDGSLNLRSR